MFATTPALLRPHHLATISRRDVVGSVPSTSPPRRVTSQRLLDGARELVIQHLDSDYYLRLTRNNKLILTK